MRTRIYIVSWFLFGMDLDDRYDPAKNEHLAAMLDRVDFDYDGAKLKQ